MNNILGKNNYSPTPIVLDGENLIYLGVPLKDRVMNTLEIQIPKTPHIFKVHRLKFNNDITIVYEDVVIATAHGGLKIIDGKYHWIFDDGQLVGDVIDKFNDQSETPVDFVIACSGNYFDPNISMGLRPLETQVSELEIYGLPKGSSYILGENIRIQSSVLPINDIICLNINCDLSKLRNPNAVLRRKSELEWREL